MSVRKIDTGYKAEVFLGLDPVTNKKIRKTKTFAKQKDAKDWEREILQAYKTGHLNFKRSMSLSDYLDYWYETYVIPNTKYQTQKRYKTLMECIKSHIGHIALDKLKTPQIDRFYADLKLIVIKKDKRRYSDGTILKVHKLLRQALEKAVGWEMIIKNPAQYATPPRQDESERETWGIDEAFFFLSKIKNSKIYLPVLIAFHTGLRIGEISALRWEDVNLKDGYLMVNHNAVEKKGEGVVLETPKTPSSNAKVVLTKDLITEFKRFKKEAKKHKLKTGIDLDFVCCWEDGRPLRPTYISKKFKEKVKQLGMRKITFHGLRHSHATILFSLGANSQEISKRLRHSRVSTTDDIYIHVKDEIKKTTANLFGQAVEKRK